MRDEIPHYLDDYNTSCLEFFGRCRLLAEGEGLALPFGGGWADQPAHLVDILTTLRAAEMARRSHETETRFRK